MIGAIQLVVRSPSSWAIWSQRRSAALMRDTTEGTEFTGYSDWSGYISPLRFASAATCQPER